METPEGSPAQPPVEEPTLDSAEESTTPSVPEENMDTDIPEVVEKPRLVQPDQQMREISFATNVLRHRKTEEAFKKHAQGGELSPAERKLINIGELKTTAPGTVFKSEEGRDDGIDLTTGNPILIELHTGQRVQVLSMKEKIQTEDGKEFFRCRILKDNDSHPGLDISVDEFVKAAYLSEATEIAKDFTPEEQQLLSLHVGILKDKDKALEGQNPDTINTLINHVSEENGVITSSDLVGLIDSQMAKLPPDQQLAATEARAMLDTQNILTDPVQFSEILTKLGCSSEGIAAQVNQTSQELADLQTQLAADPNNDALKEKVSQAQLMLSLMQQTQETAAATPDLGAYLQKMQTGEIDTAKAKEIAKHIREGNIEGIIANISPELMADPTDTPEEAAIKEQKRKELAEKVAGMGLMGIGAIFMLLWQVAAAESKAVKQSMR